MLIYKNDIPELLENIVAAKSNFVKIDEVMNGGLIESDAPKANNVIHIDPSITREYDALELEIKNMVLGMEATFTNKQGLKENMTLLTASKFYKDWSERLLFVANANSRNKKFNNKKLLNHFAEQFAKVTVTFTIISELVENHLKTLMKNLEKSTTNLNPVLFPPENDNV